MGSLESYLEKTTFKRDRGLDEFTPDYFHEIYPSSKRSCTVVAKASPEEHHQQQLNLLEDLYGLAFTPEPSILESGTPEELVSEMMKSLEKVISASEESFMPAGRNHSGKKHGKQEEYISCGDEDLTPPTGENGSSESEVDIKFLFEASDDELGIPPSPNSDGDKLCNLPQDASWLDSSYPELDDCVNLQLVTEVDDESWRYGTRMANGVAGVLEQEGRVVSEREYFDLGLSDCYL